MGFLRRRDYAAGELSVGHGWRYSDSPLLTYSIGMNGAAFRRNADGVIETAEFQPTTTIQTRGRHSWTLSFPYRYEDLNQGFSLPGGASVAAGVYHFTAARLQYRAPQSALVRPGLTIEAGQFYDGRQASISFSPQWSPNMHLGLGGGYSLDYVDFADRSESVTAHVARFRAEVMVSATTSAVGFVQYNSTQDAVIANLRFHYNPREGNDLYIVWNEGLVTDRHSFDPVPPFSSERTLLVKYSHTLQRVL